MIGILTFHCAHNYGAVLQCYALQETLKAMGHDVKIIDYRPDFLLASYKIWDIHRYSPRNLPKRFILECLTLTRRMIRHRSFESFINKRLCLTKEHIVPSSFDVYIMGSDQIWNPLITNGFHKPYFGCFDFPKENRKYIAYAASMDTSFLNQENKDFLLEALDNFDAISVREETLADLLQPLTSKKIEIVLDPTMLADATTWDSIVKRPFVDYKYVLVYQVKGDIRTSTRIAQNIANQIGAKVIEIAAGVGWRHNKNVHMCCPPEEFLGWIKYAACVVTTSFHGAAFSIIFGKPFYYLKLGEGNTRAASLLQALGLDTRVIEKTLSIDFQAIDYKNISKKITDLQKKSYRYLASSLSL